MPLVDGFAAIVFLTSFLGFLASLLVFICPLTLAVDAMGQTVSTVLDVSETHITLQLQLPAMLSFMSGAIEKAIRAGAGKVLLEDKSKG